MERIRGLMRQHEKNLMKMDNVVGLGVGYKIVGGKITKEPAVLVLVKKKVPEEALLARHRVPRALGHTSTDVIEVGEVRLLDARVERARPAKPGMSIGHYRISAGTFGALVKDEVTGEPLILSNNHVLANATDGYDGKSKVGDSILQPGAHDGGTPSDIIATLERFVPISKNTSASRCAIAHKIERGLNGVLRLVKPDYKLTFVKKSSARNLIDAAVAKPVKSQDVASDIVGLGKISGISEVKLGNTLKKSGRTSGITSSKVNAIDVVLKVMIGPEEEATFYDQILTGPMAQPGDSGSIVIDSDMRAVGLLFAGSDQATIINPITTVMKLLKITF